MAGLGGRYGRKGDRLGSGLRTVHCDGLLGLGCGQILRVAGLVGVDDAAARPGVGHRGAVGAGYVAHSGPLEESTENTTGLPESPPVADKLAEDSRDPDDGAVKVIVWGRPWPLP